MALFGPGIAAFGSIMGCGLNSDGLPASTVACDFAPVETLDEIRGTYELFRESGGTEEQAFTDPDSSPTVLCGQAVDVVVAESGESLDEMEIDGLRRECAACLTAVIGDVFGD